MQIETPRLILREFKSEDWERVHLYASQADFSMYEGWGPNSEEDTKKFIADAIGYAQFKPRFKFEFAICLKENGFLIGGGGIRRAAQESQIADIGWGINPDFQNQGYATELARALIKFGFEQLGLTIVYATCDARNVASFRVMEKAGMKRVGLIEKDRMQKGHMRDTSRYEIQKSN
jgi:RimJ/RimL family protein N-acetyltransferase